MQDYFEDLLQSGKSDEPEKSAPSDYFEEMLGRKQQQAQIDARIPVDQVSGEVERTGLDVPGVGFLERQRRGAMVGAGRLLNADDQAAVDIIRKQVPEAEFATAEDGAAVVRGNPQEPWRYINQPGLSGQDAVNFAGEAAKFAPAAKVAALGGGLLSRVGLGAVASGTTSVAADAAAEPLGSEQGVNAGKAVAAAAGGGAGEVIGAAVGGVGAFIRSSLSKKAANSAARKTVLADKLAEETAQRSTLSRDGAFTADQLAEEFSVRLTRGQAGGDTAQQAFESSALKGARGPEAQQVMEKFYSGQLGEIKAAAASFSGAANPRSQRDAIGLVQRGLSDAAGALDQEIDKAYEVTRSMKASLSVDGVQEMAQALRSVAPEEVAAESILSDPKRMARLYPQTTDAVAELKGVSERIAAFEQRSGTSLAAVDFRELERYRRTLNAAIDAAEKGSADRRGVTAMKAAFDGWIDNAFARGMFSGDQEFLDAMQKARGLRTKYGAQFQQQGARDYAGKVISDILENDPTPEETMNLIFGGASLGAKRGSSQAVHQLADILGRESPEFVALKDAAIDRVMGRGLGRGGDQLRIGSMIEAWNDALSGSGRSVMEEMFPPEDLKQMRQFVAVLKRIEPKPGAVNTSNTAVELTRQLRGVMSSGSNILPMALKRIAEGAVDPDKLKATIAVRGAQRPLTSLPTPVVALSPAAVTTGLQVSNKPE